MHRALPRRMPARPRPQPPSRGRNGGAPAHGPLHLVDLLVRQAPLHGAVRDAIALARPALMLKGCGRRRSAGPGTIFPFFPPPCSSCMQAAAIAWHWALQDPRTPPTHRFWVCKGVQQLHLFHEVPSHRAHLGPGKGGEGRCMHAAAVTSQFPPCPRPSTGCRVQSRALRPWQARGPCPSWQGV